MTDDREEPSIRVLRPRPKTIGEVLRSIRTFQDWHALRTHFLAQVDWSSSRRRRRSESFDRPVPWWPYSCTHFLQQVVTPDATVLEFGAGASTAWWLGRGNRVTSLESSAVWAEVVRTQCARFVDRLDLSVVDFRVSEFGTLQNQSFDVIVIDNEGPRTELVPTAMNHLDPRGLIIFDNADREAYAEAMASLTAHGYRRLDFFGLGPINAYASLTSIFTRSGVIEIKGQTQSFATVSY